MLYDASSVVHLRSSPRPTPATSTGDFSVTLTTTPHSTQQLTAVWNHRLNNQGRVKITDRYGRYPE
jgi:hypothetical protein